MPSSGIQCRPEFHSDSLNGIMGQLNESAQISSNPRLLGQIKLRNEGGRFVALGNASSRDGLRPAKTIR